MERARMNNLRHISITFISSIVLFLSGMNPLNAQSTQPPWMKDSMAKLENELVSKYGEEQRARWQRRHAAGHELLALGR